MNFDETLIKLFYPAAPAYAMLCKLGHGLARSMQVNSRVLGFVSEMDDRLRKSEEMREVMENGEKQTLIKLCSNFVVTLFELC